MGAINDAGATVLPQAGMWGMKKWMAEVTRPD
jgi:hypothetical protein